MTNVEGRMNNERTLSFYIGIISIKRWSEATSIIRHSSFVIRHSKTLKLKLNF